MNRKKLLWAGAGFVLIALAFLAILLGINLDGKYEVGHKVAYMEISNAMREGHKDGVAFTIKGIPGVVFYPRDSVRRTELNYTIAGMGDTGKRSVWGK